MIWITDGCFMLYSQKRIGKEGEIFTFKKQWTMSVRPLEGRSITVAGDSRITPIGRYLLRWKLNELPQLWNVLVGEMSLVCPRPDVPG
ncbi:sugar transferase [Microcoleus sp. ARI1-B5]|uniref:sugar transferase n=1 Tax=Microcoleus sp. ARI1-A1 TaxID=2818556 RepID=UPI002FD4B061